MLKIFSKSIVLFLIGIGFLYNMAHSKLEQLHVISAHSGEEFATQHFHEDDQPFDVHESQEQNHDNGDIPSGGSFHVHCHISFEINISQVGFDLPLTPPIPTFSSVSSKETIPTSTLSFSLFRPPIA